MSEHKMSISSYDITNEIDIKYMSNFHLEPEFYTVH